MMIAVLYVAGRAVRLGEAGEDQPKVMLRFGGQTLFERHVALLAGAGVTEVCAVTGYLREQIQAEFARLESRYHVRITECFNPDYMEGSALSMHASLPVIERAGKDLLLMDGDVLYDWRMLDRLVRSAHPSVLLVDRGFSTADDDPVLVPMRAGKPFDFVKKWRGAADAVGESIGFFRLGPADRPLLAEETMARSAGSGRRDSYDDILRVLVRAGRFEAEDVTGLPWTEIDFPEDLAHANKVIFPVLQGAPRL